MRERKFLIVVELVDLQPCQDERDIHALREIIANNFGSTYLITDLKIKELRTNNA